MKIISFGEVMIEMADVGGALYQKNFAGDTFNVAYYMKVQAPNNWDIQYATCLGKQVEDARAIDFIKANNIGTDNIIYHQDRTIGLFLLNNDKSGEKQYSYWRGLSAAKTYFDRVKDFSNFDLVYFSGITVAITENKENLLQSISQAKGSGVKIVYDMQHRRQLWSLQEAERYFNKIMPYCDMVKISDEEWDWIFQDNQTIEELSHSYPHIEIIFTGAGKKPTQRWLDGECISIDVKQVAVVDSSAAGDAFIASYLVNRLADHPPIVSLEKASRITAVVLHCKGSLAPVNVIQQALKKD